MSTFVFGLPNHLRYRCCRIQQTTDLTMQRIQKFVLNALTHRIVPEFFGFHPDTFQLLESILKSCCR
jgi:hypothetical protein